jgi:pimeloyl-ACP methyl ester carboxylesterase
MLVAMGRNDAMSQREWWESPMAREARAIPELAAFMVAAGPLLVRLPRGDGHAVLVLPGLGGSDTSTAPLRWILAQLGYRSYGWGLGRNTGFGRHVDDGLDELLAARREAGPVSLIGWSLGGLHAVDLARRRPDAVRSIITLGSPLAAHVPPPTAIPTTSVYSRTDAIVPWRTSLLAPRARSENVEVTGSHLGLGHNPAAVVVVADRLAQPTGNWRPYTAPRWARSFGTATGRPVGSPRAATPRA